MEFSEIIAKVNSDKRLVPDLMKSEKGNNFRAISESAILDVIDPVLKEAEWFYTVEVKKSDLQIREAYGSKGKKLQFVATVEVKIMFHKETLNDNSSTGTIITPLNYACIKREEISTEAVGMGIDDNDKAMGKAYTYAIKYALLKLFRLRYGDDPDAKASEPLYLDKPKETVAKEEKNTSKKPTSSGEKAMTEAQRDYILGMMKDKGFTDRNIMDRFDGYEPSKDEYIPMKVARAMIKWLEEQTNLPF